MHCTFFLCCQASSCVHMYSFCVSTAIHMQSNNTAHRLAYRRKVISRGIIRMMENNMLMRADLQVRVSLDL